MPVNLTDLLSALGNYSREKLLPALIALVMGILVIRIILAVINKFLSATHLEKAAHGLIRSLAKAVLYLLLGLIVASGLGIDVTGVVALASVLTLAVSLSVQNALTNIIGGFTLLYTQPFHSGDYVDIASRSGTVTEISMTYTKLTTPDNKVISIPNSAVVAGDIVNYSVTGTRRVEIPVRASYETPVQKVLDTLIQAATMDKVLLDPSPMAVVMSYGENAIHYELRIWTKSADYWDVKFEINQKIQKLFLETGIDMTYNHLNVHMKG